MGIDIYASWRNQTEAEKAAQITGFDATSGDVGYLREAYHGEPYVTRFFVREAFDQDREDVRDGLGAPIPAATLRARLPRAIELAITRQKVVYGCMIDEHDPIAQSYVRFVELCEAKERETGESVFVIASY